MLSSGYFVSPDPIAVLVLLLDQIASDLGASVVPWRVPLQVARLLIVVHDLKVPWRSGFAKRILGHDSLVAFKRQRFTLFIDGTDPELVLLHRRQTLDIHGGVWRSAARNPESGVWIELLNLVVFNGAAAVILGPAPFQGTAGCVNVGSLWDGWLVTGKN